MTYNLVNTFDWFKDNVQAVTHDPKDWTAAMAVANDRAVVPTGLLFEAQRATFHDMSHPIRADAGVPDPVAASADPAKAVAAARKRFDGWLGEFRAR